MKKIFLLCMCAFVFFANILAASDEVSIATTRPVIMLISRGTIRVPLVIKVRNHRDNRALRLDWGWGAKEFQLNNPTAKEIADGSHERFLREKEYLLFTDEDFQESTTGPSGLLLPIGQYEIRVTLTRIVDGEKKEFTSKVEVTIGVKEDKQEGK